MSLHKEINFETEILFDGYLMKRGHDAAGEIKNRRFTGNFTDLSVDSYLMVI